MTCQSVQAAEISVSLQRRKGSEMFCTMLTAEAHFDSALQQPFKKTQQAWLPGGSARAHGQALGACRLLHINTEEQCDDHATYNSQDHIQCHTSARRELNSRPVRLSWSGVSQSLIDPKRSTKRRSGPIRFTPHATRKASVIRSSPPSHQSHIYKLYFKRRRGGNFALVTMHAEVMIYTTGEPSPVNAAAYPDSRADRGSTASRNASPNSAHWTVLLTGDVITKISATFHTYITYNIKLRWSVRMILHWFCSDISL